MFDPLGIRKLNRRYYSRKGQINQVKATNSFTGVYIDPNQVQSYKDYLINQRLIHRSEILDDDPDISKEHFDVDDIITLKDLLDMFPQDSIPIQARLMSKTTLSGPIYINGWDEHISFYSGLVATALFTNNIWTNSASCVKAIDVPLHASAAHEGLRMLQNMSVSSTFEINWKNANDYVGRIEDGDVYIKYAPFYGGGEINDQTLYTNCDSTTNKATYSSQDTVSFEFLNSTQRDYNLHIDWERSDPIDLTLFNPNITQIGAWIGRYDANGENSHFEPITVLNDLSIDIYYYKYNP